LGGYERCTAAAQANDSIHRELIQAAKVLWIDLKASLSQLLAQIGQLMWLPHAFIGDSASADYSKNQKRC